jgi:hypothetical protein
MPGSVVCLRIRFRPPLTDLPVAVGFMKPEMQGWGKHPIAFAIFRVHSIVVRYEKCVSTHKSVRQQA